MIGDPFDRKTQVGPLISENSYEQMQAKLEACKQKSLSVYGGERIDGEGVFVKPAIVESNDLIEEMNEETFAPILYVMKYTNLKDAIALQNSVNKGLAAAFLQMTLENLNYF